VTWWWISLPQYTIAIGARSGTVALAPPIASWARGKSEDRVLGYFRRKGARICPLPES
jgi:hypothetical protein